MSYRGLLLVLSVTLLLLFDSRGSRAQEYNALQKCIALSPLIDDIHTCMDNYLDLLDSSLNNITAFIAESLDDEARTGLESSQEAFVEYRRQNCLWYLEFSSPRSEAEQIAKNCLASMSQQRLRELQELLRTDDGETQIVNGFYVYGSERNSFQPCGSRSRYWVEGDERQVAELQQQYLSTASSELQVMFASLAGTVSEEMSAPVGHQGVFELNSLADLRVPTESDCLMPATTLRAQEPEGGLSSASLPVIEEPVADIDETSQEEVEEQLVGYFGDWIADCSASGGVRGCRLQVDLSAGVDAPDARLALIRRMKQDTVIEAFFSEREIDSPARIRWSVDAVDFGDIVGSEIRVDQSGTRQIVVASPFVDEELLPMIIQGNDVFLDVLASVDDASGIRYRGSLIGVTDAMIFADDFIRLGGI